MKNKLLSVFVVVLVLGMLGMLAVVLFDSRGSVTITVPSSAVDAADPSGLDAAACRIDERQGGNAAAAAAAKAAADSADATSPSADDDEAPAPKVEPGALATRRQQLDEAIIRRQIERREARRARLARKNAAKHQGNGASHQGNGGGTAATGDYKAPTPEEIDAMVAAELAELAEREPMTAVDNFSQSVQDVTEMWWDADIEITSEIAKEFKAEFDKMSADEKVENIHEALNRFDDNYLECLKAIVTDASEPAEVLEKTVYDLGNRDWDKVRPIFEEVAANPKHSQNAAAKEWLADHPAENVPAS